MDLTAELFKDCSKNHIQNLARKIAKDPDLFARLMALFFDKKYATHQRISWTVAHCVEEKPDIMTPFLEDIILQLRQPDRIPAIRRNTLKIIADHHPTLTEDLRGHLVDVAFNLLLSPKEPVAVKVHAMQVLFDYCQSEPELLEELRLIIEEQLPNATAGFKSRGKKILKAIRQIIGKNPTTL